jgi:hypothetical protein
MGTDSPTDDDTTTTRTSTTELACPVCWASFWPVGRQRFCSGNCRKTAWSRTRQDRLARPVEPVPPAGRQRGNTVYRCSSCEVRYHGQQWCHDCNQPCTRIGLGGLCPHCEEPVALTDLLDPPKEVQTG